MHIFDDYEIIFDNWIFLIRALSSKATKYISLFGISFLLRVDICVYISLTFESTYPHCKEGRKGITRRVPFYRLIDLRLLIAINLEPRT